MCKFSLNLKMMKYLLFLILISSFSTVIGQTKPISIGFEKTIHSKILDENRNLWIHIPKSEEGDIIVLQKYPVVYVLDGNGHFSSVVGMIERLSSKYSNHSIPKMIVVGIPNTNRDRDLTPTKGNINDPFVNQAVIDALGGGDNFLQFIKKELVPYIEQNYPATSYKTFIGHSSGGLTIMHTFQKYTNLFDAYIAIDPSMWWNKGELLSDIKYDTIANHYANKTLYLGIANNSPKQMKLKEVLIDTTNSTIQNRKNFELDTYMKRKFSENFKYKGFYYENENHATVPVITTYDGLRFIFKNYQFEFQKEDFGADKEELFAKITNHFTKISKQLGYVVFPEINLVNNLGQEFLAMKEFEIASKFLNLNLHNYPKVSNVYESLGDLYKEKGDFEKAKEKYREALAINEKSSVKEKLVDLIEKQH